MGLDVGTVREVRLLEQIHRTGVCRKFAWYLAENYDEAHWGLAEGENVIAEYTLESLLSFANSYAESASLSDTDKAEIDRLDPTAPLARRPHRPPLQLVRVSVKLSMKSGRGSLIFSRDSFLY